MEVTGSLVSQKVFLGFLDSHPPLPSVEALPHPQFHLDSGNISPLCSDANDYCIIIVPVLPVLGD